MVTACGLALEASAQLLGEAKGRFRRAASVSMNHMSPGTDCDVSATLQVTSDQKRQWRRLFPEQNLTYYFR